MECLTHLYYTQLINILQLSEACHLLTALYECTNGACAW